MSDFDPSPRSSKRRKTTRNSTSQSPANSVYGNISRAVTGISRSLFKSKAEAASQSSPKPRDSTYGSKEDSLEGEEGYVESSQLRNGGLEDSADELASPEITATPTKSISKSKKGRGRETAEAADKATTPDPLQDDDGLPNGSGSGLRTSGRERKKPKRFENPSPKKKGKGVSKATARSAKEKTPEEVAETEIAESVPEPSMSFKEIPKATTTPKTATKKPSRKVQMTPKSAKRRLKSPPVEKDFTEVAEHTPAADHDEESEAAENDQVEEAQDLAVPEVPVIDIPHSKTSSAVSNPQLDPLKSVVLRRLNGQNLSPLANLETEYNKVHSLLSASVKAGEGNSMLLLGCRGAGKTCLVETAISELSAEHAQDFHVVRLNGFIQTDDKLALKEIWRQLGREMEVQEEESAQAMTLADTMASLLHLLSHPEELSEVLDASAPERSAKSIIFVMDEFDLFTTHSRQTLLYNLFDIAQARKAPIAVIGCTTRIDVTDHLEKRVKSRFSHRWIYVPQAKSLPAFEGIVKAALTVSGNLAGEPVKVPKKLREEWNDYIERIFLPTPAIQTLLKRAFYAGKSIPDLYASLYLDILSINSLKRAPETTFSTATRAPDSNLALLPHIPLLHLSLLISAARLDAIYNATIITFSLVYNHYVDLISRARLQVAASGSIAQGLKLWSREVSVGAWEDLVEWEIMLPAAGKGVDGIQTKLWKCDVVLEEIVDAVGGKEGGMSDVMLKWCKEV